MSRTNETRHIKWHKTYKCGCRLNSIVCNNKQRWNRNKCRCEYKELIDKGVCDKGYFWNPCNREWKCDKSCDIGEYLDYKNCACKKGLVDKLVDECNETIDEEVEIIDNNKNNPCIVYIVIFSMFFTFNVGIGAYVAYYK